MKKAGQVTKRVLRRIFSIKSGKTVGRVTFWVIRYTGRAMIVSAEMLFHRHFGERYWSSMILSLFTFYIYIRVVPLFIERHNTILLEHSLWLLAGLCLLHCLGMLLRSQHERDNHSFDSGLPWASWERLSLRPQIVIRYCEPLLAFGLGSLLGRYDYAIGFWWKGAAVGMLFKGQFSRQRERTRVLDSLDSRIESKHLQHAIAARTAPRESAQVSAAATAHSAESSFTDTRTGADHFESLDPDLKKLIEHDAGPK